MSTLQQVPQHIAFIDSRVSPDAREAVLAALGGQGVLRLVDASQDGLAQIADALQGVTGLQAIHVVSHASAGGVLLGSSWLGLQGLRDRSEALARIGSALSATGDLLFYGCNLAQGAEGAAWLALMASLTGADVAASNNLTGQSGDGVLEASVGVVETGAIDLGGMGGALVVVTGTEGADTFSGGDGDDLIEGLGGNDVLTVGQGSDTLDGGAGNDTLTVYTGGNHSVTGGTGDDDIQVYPQYSGGSVHITDLGRGNDRLFVYTTISNFTTSATLADHWSPTYSYNSNYNRIALSSNGFNVNLTNAGAGNGYGFSVTNTGSAASFTGSYANDILVGGAGDDTLNGGGGYDTLTGGAGVDTFVVSPGSTAITDFGAGDLIQLPGISLEGAVTAGNGSSTALNRVDLQVAGSTSYLYFGTDNSPGANLVVQLNGSYRTEQFEIISGSVRYKNTPATGGVQIAGTPTQGEILTASNTLGDLDGIPLTGPNAITYQWKADGIDIAGATGSTFNLTPAELGKTISVSASYTDAFGTPEKVVSESTLAIRDFNAHPVSSTRAIGSAFNDQASAIAIAPDGSSYLGGSSPAGLSSLGLGPVLDGSPDAQGPYFVSRLDAAGNAQWVRALPGWMGLDVAALSTGAVAAGTVQTSSGKDVVVSRFDTSGNILWTTAIDAPLGTLGDNDTAFRVASGSADAVFVAGLTNEAWPSNTDIFVSKLDANGVLLWSTGLTSESPEWVVTGLLQGIDGRLYVAGSTYGNLQGEANNGVRDAFVSCLDTDGSVLWTRLIGDGNYDDAYDVTQGADGSIYLSGTAYGPIGTNAQQGLTDGFLTRLLPDGTVQWTQTFGTSVYDALTGIEVLPNGDVLGVLDSAEYVQATQQWIQAPPKLMRIDASGNLVWQQSLDVAGVASVADLALRGPNTVELLGSFSDAFAGIASSGEYDIFLSTVDFNRAPTGSLTVAVNNGHTTATLTQGDTLTASNTLTDADGIPVSGPDAITYQWQANGSNIAGATGSTFTLTQAEVGKAISVVASYMDNFGSDETVRSDATSTVIGFNTAPWFGVGNGQATTDLGRNDYGYSNVVQGDGKLVVAGRTGSGFAGGDGSEWDFGLVRYNPDGSLDASFGTGGKLITDFGGRGDYGYSVIVQTDGKLVTAGYSVGFKASVGYNDYDFAVARYNADGSLDTTFGDGGRLLTDRLHGDVAYEVALQPDGKVLLAGQSTFGTYDFALLRYNADGSLDSTFSDDGWATVDVAGRNEIARGLVVQPDGKIVLAGYSDNGSNWDFGLTRLNADGTLDSTFGSEGRVTTDITGNHDLGFSLARQADGKLLVGGRSLSASGWDFSVARYNLDGSLDTSFSEDGKLTTNVGGLELSGWYDPEQDLVLQQDGKILVAGGAGGNFALLRYNTDGSLDTTFSGDGRLSVDLGGVDKGNSLTVQPNGKIIVAGSSSGDYAIARVNADGSLDTGFNRTANTLNGTPTYTENGAAVVLDSDVQVFDAELSALGNYAGASLTLQRHGSANPEDLYSGSGALGALIEGSALTLGGITIGSVVQNSSGVLTLTLNDNATQARVNQALQSIAYSNSSDTPSAPVQIDWTFSDGNSGAQGAGGALSVTGSTTVSLVPTNDAPTGTVTIAVNNGHNTTTLVQGDTLTASHTLVDPDGIPATGLNAIAYQWRANGIDIAGATNTTLLLGQDQAGKAITVRVAYTDDYGTLEEITSQPTALVIGALNLIGDNLANTLTGGQANDTLSGLGGNDTLLGQAGNDTLDGGVGNDSLVGGTGDDLYVVDVFTDAVVELSDEGTDTVRTGLIAYTLGGHLERLEYSGALAFTGTGNVLNNAITGGVGNDTLNGAAGDDTLSGGLGSDSYVLDSLSDVVIEAAAGGTDTIRTALSGLTLMSEVENFVYTGTVSFAVTGNGLNNSITGAAGADTLDGGAGNDTMVGGTGNDTYWVDAAGDVTTEVASGGFDTVRTTLGTYTLANEIDAAIYLGAGTFVATGNALNNSITGAAGNDTLNGGLGNDTLDGAAGNDVMVGGAGNDTYRVDGLGDVITELAGGGVDTVLTALGSYTLGTELDALTFVGEGNFNGVGNALANTLVGGAGNDSLSGGLGNDSLDGGAGNDSMTGGAGNDTYVIDSLSDVIVELAAGGTDTVRTTLTVYTLPTEIESLTYLGVAALTATGNALANTLVGGAGNDSLSGGLGNDSLDGLGGSDTLVGEAGNDTFVIDSLSDVIVELAGGGTDTVRTSLATYTLGDQLENLTSTGTLAFTGIGNALANVLTGAAAADQLQGGEGNDTLSGMAGNDTLVGEAGNDSLDGGAGIDSMTGGAGNDTYVIDSVSDVIVELAAGGTDMVRTNLATYTLGDQLENLTSTGTVAFTGIGNALANVLTGAAAADQLQGGEGNDTLSGMAGNDTLLGEAGNDSLDGGAGIDSMTGGEGNDTYVIDSVSDVVVELAGGGTDTVRTALTSYTLQAEIENLTATGTGALTGNGNALANFLTGAGAADRLQAGDGNDTLIGAAGNDTLLGEAGNDSLDGGAGTDSMTGGEGNDTYVVDSGTDVIVELAGGGTDTVRTALTSYTLQAEIENLTATSTFALTGNGNALANVLTGSSGADVLSGNDGDDTLVGGAGNDSLRGGAGADRLTGDAGSDVFVYGSLTDSPSASGQQDRITDFMAGTDRIGLSAIDANTALAADQAFVWIGAAALTAAAQVNAVYDPIANLTVLSANVNADLAPDWVVHLEGNLAASLSAASFIL
jgi:uncharacterized delta-60 repeat protein